MRRSRVAPTAPSIEFSIGSTASRASPVSTAAVSAGKELKAIIWSSPPARSI
jgi:hypothetical protein